MDYAQENREIVLPGQLLGKARKFDLTCFAEDGNVYSAVQGLFKKDERDTYVIPSKGPYIPKEGDVIIGIVDTILETVWIVDIASPYASFILKEEVVKTRDNVDLRDYFKVGDIVSGKVDRINEVHSHLLIRPWKLEAGLVIHVNPKRIPRIIGKNRSMLEIIKSKTGTQIIVGQNGRIWLKGGNIDLAIESIKKIEREAQTRGLTERITKFLNDKSQSKEGK